MTRYMIALTVALTVMAGFVVSSCSKSPESKVQGTWSADFVASLEDQDIGDEERQLVEHMAQNVALTLQFTEDGRMTVVMSGFGDEDRSKEGHWEVISAEGNDVIVRVRETDEEGAEGREMVLTFQDEDRFTAEFSGRITVFNRQ